MLYEVQFGRLLYAVERSGEDASEHTHAMSLDISCIARRIAELLNSEHDWLRLQDISHFLDLQYALIDLGVAWAHILLSTVVRDMVWTVGREERGIKTKTSTLVYGACYSDDNCSWSGSETVAISVGTGDLQQRRSREGAVKQVCCRVCHGLLTKGAPCTLNALACRLRGSEGCGEYRPWSLKFSYECCTSSENEVVIGDRMSQYGRKGMWRSEWRSSW